MSQRKILPVNATSPVKGPIKITKIGKKKEPEPTQEEIEEEFEDLDGGTSSDIADLDEEELREIAKLIQDNIPRETPTPRTQSPPMKKIVTPRNPPPKKVATPRNEPTPLEKLASRSSTPKTEPTKVPTPKNSKPPSKAPTPRDKTPKSKKVKEPEIIKDGKEEVSIDDPDMGSEISQMAVGTLGLLGLSQFL